MTESPSPAGAATRRSAWWHRLARSPLLPALLALALTAAACFAQWRIDFNIADEGFLWYGAIATAHGQVPLRDFMSYDPGRYYWAAAWAPLFGDGILALRASTAIFQALGIFFGLLAARRAIDRPWLLALAGAVLLIWMIPRHKVFEPSVAMAAVWVGARLLERPSAGRHFAAGVLAGLAVLMGKNLGLYCLAAMTVLALIARAGGGAGEAAEARGSGEVPAEPPGEAPVPLPPATEGLPRTPVLEAPLPGAQAPRAQVPGPQAPVPEVPVPGAPASAAPGAFRRRALLRDLAAFAAGLLAGLLPLLVLCCVPGFLASYVESCLFFLRLGRTNFPEPLPWPWLAFAPGLDAGERAQQLSLGLSFVLLVAGTAAVLAAGCRRWWRGAAFGRRPAALLLSGGVVGLFFLHHAFARADVFHLGQSVPPLLLAALALPAGAASPAGRRWRAAMVVGPVAVCTLLTPLPEAPLFHLLSAARPSEKFVPFDLAGDRICLRRHAVRVLGAVRDVFTTQVPSDEPALFATHFAGLYPFLGRRSPVWEVYPIWPGLGGRDERMLRELEVNDVRWALIGAYAMQGGEELTLAETHPKTWSYLMREFERLPAGELPRRFLLLHRR
jgi:hypothetical protein